MSNATRRNVITGLLAGSAAALAGVFTSAPADAAEPTDDEVDGGQP